MERAAVIMNTTNKHNILPSEHFIYVSSRFSDGDIVIGQLLSQIFLAITGNIANTAVINMPSKKRLITRVPPILVAIYNRMMGIFLNIYITSSC